MKNQTIDTAKTCVNRDGVAEYRLADEDLCYVCASEQTGAFCDVDESDLIEAFEDSREEEEDLLLS